MQEDDVKQEEAIDKLDEEDIEQSCEENPTIFMIILWIQLKPMLLIILNPQPGIHRRNCECCGYKCNVLVTRQVILVGSEILKLNVNVSV